MLKVRTFQHGDGVCLEITTHDLRHGRYESSSEVAVIVLFPEMARMLGVGLIEDAAAADCYRREMAGPFEEVWHDGRR